MVWKIWEILADVAGPLFLYYLAANIITMMGGLHFDAAFLTSLTALVLLPVYLWMYRKTQRKGGTYRKGKHFGIGEALLTILLAVLCNLALTFLINLLLRYVPLSNAQQEALFAGNIAVQIIGLGFLTPAMEEVLFRGLVYRRLKGYTKTAWFFAAVLFALYHGNAIQMMFAFPMALILTLLYDRYGTLKAPVIFHMAVNLSSILFTFLSV